jgi:hypothetical protein
MWKQEASIACSQESVASTFLSDEAWAGLSGNANSQNNINDVPKVPMPVLKLLCMTLM